MEAVSLRLEIWKMGRFATATFQQRYLADSPESEPWGIAVTAGGRQVSEPGAPYPPAGHPEDHAFAWENGRVLSACQIVFISAGRGRFESRATGLRAVEAGTALVILPNVWHRYAPDPRTGWTERWIELRGSIVGALLARESLSPKRAVVPIGRVLEFSGLFDAIQARLVGDAVLACDPERGALGLQVLAMLAAATEQGPAARSMQVLIGRAERLLADSVEHAPAMPELARQLGVAYSHFRREFKRHTGLSPHRYLNQLRLEKALRLMGASDEPLKAIAERLGFSSPYHFSAAFKQQFGLAPEHWRRQQRAAGSLR